MRFGRLSLLLCLAAVAACSDDSGDSHDGYFVGIDPLSEVHPDREGAVVLRITAPEGIRWQAEIVDGDNWISFGRTAAGSSTLIAGIAGTSLADRSRYIYYWPNATRNERHATIRFAFEGREADFLTLTQYSISSEDDVYTLGQAAVWPEIPAEREGATLRYVTHTAEMRDASGLPYTARNYTLCYDSDKLAAWWVAYPLHLSHTGSGRTEAWAYDPKIATDDQADLARSYPAREYDRGHQIPNADRSANAAMQAQTFYFSNITPQWAQLNQQPWAALERMARDEWICADTLYVVTGAWWGSAPAVTPDRNGRLCPVPDAYFKLFLRTVAGNVRRRGDLLSDYGASELKTIGFWVGNREGQGVPRDWVRSVEEVERLTGFEFFPTVDPAVKRLRDAASWGL